MLTSVQVANLLNVKPSTFRNWIRCGWIKPSLTTPGGHYFFTSEDVEKIKQSLLTK